jgi:hypothetical protein
MNRSFHVLTLGVVIMARRRHRHAIAHAFKRLLRWQSSMAAAAFVCVLRWFKLASHQLAVQPRRGRLRLMNELIDERTRSA